MGTIHNPTTTTFHLPAILTKRGKDGDRKIAHPSPGMVRPGEVVEVTDGYLAALSTHKCWGGRIEGSGRARSIAHHKGVAGRFESRILAGREAKAEAKSTTERVEALENEAAATRATVEA